MHPNLKPITLLTTILSLIPRIQSTRSAHPNPPNRLSSREVASAGIAQTGLTILHHGETLTGGYAIYGSDNTTTAGRRLDTLLVADYDSYNCTVGENKYARFTCDPEHGPNRSQLSELLWNLKTFDQEADLAEGYKAFCAWTWGEHWIKACASWHHETGPIRVNWLWPAAKQTNIICNGNRGGFWDNGKRLGGVAFGVIIGTVCTHQCLSDRPDGC